MIAQWENECISLSVLSVARVIIAQWENESISLSVLSAARVMITQWENECISRSVLSVTQVQFSAVVENSRAFSLADNTRLEDGHHQVVTSPLKEYEEYEAIQILLPSGPRTIKNGHGFLLSHEYQSL